MKPGEENTEKPDMRKTHGIRNQGRDPKLTEHQRTENNADDPTAGRNSVRAKIQGTGSHSSKSISSYAPSQMNNTNKSKSSVNEG